MLVVVVASPLEEIVVEGVRAGTMRDSVMHRPRQQRGGCCIPRHHRQRTARRIDHQVALEAASANSGERPYSLLATTSPWEVAPRDGSDTGASSKYGRTTCSLSPSPALHLLILSHPPMCLEGCAQCRG